MRGAGANTVYSMKNTMRLLTALFSGLFGSSCGAEGPQVSRPAPMVSGVNQEGVTVNFAEVYARGPTVVFFYPKANTPGCTAQACSLRDAFAELTKQGVQVLGVSMDTVERQKKFKVQRKLPYDLIADTEGKVMEAFKVGKAMGGLLPMSQRQCFLIKGGEIVWHDESAATAGQADDIKKVLASLK